MERFTPIDLARLPPLPATAPTFEATYAAYMADLTARMVAKGIPYDVGALETDTYAITGQAFAYRTTLVAQSIDDAIKAVLLPTSYGAYLDNLGATQDPPVQRKALVANPRPYVYDTPAAADWDGDDSFRALIALAPDALSTCGPEGAYLFFALDVAGCVAASVYGPMSFGGSPGNPFVPLGEVHIPILASAGVSAANGGQGDGTAPPALVAAVQAALRAKDRRPIADFVTVSAAIVQPYTVAATLLVGPGADPGTVLNAAYARMRAAADLAHMPGGQMLDQDVYTAVKVPDAQGRPVVGKAVLIGWADVNGADPIPGASDPAFVAPWCAPGDPVVTAVDDDTTQLVAGGITLRIVASDG